MIRVRRWDNGDFSSPRPLAFCGCPPEPQRPSSFPFRLEDFLEVPHGPRGTARIFYKLGWTAVIFWNRDIFFVDETLTFDAMIELIRARFSDRFYLQAPVQREYVD